MSEKLADTVTVVERQGLVIVGTPERPIAALDPESARALGEALCKKAYRATFGDDPDKNVNLITAQVRSRLVTRVALMLRSMQKDAKTAEFCAAAMVDEVLKEVS